ncbi:hypothetical protein Tco_0140988 [Tanacetum coccineum]
MAPKRTMRSTPATTTTITTPMNDSQLKVSLGVVVICKLKSAVHMLRVGTGIFNICSDIRCLPLKTSDDEFDYVGRAAYHTYRTEPLSYMSLLHYFIPRLFSEPVFLAVYQSLIGEIMTRREPEPQYLETASQSLTMASGHTRDGVRETEDGVRTSPPQKKP